MRSSTLLDSAIFQLTPTRTRCDLIIIAKGETEKIATGLLDPFLAHLKTAQDQIAKGGYSILLEPKSEQDASWFTKGTLERFVRFVSTPDILERVYTIESEILQIEEAIVIQGKNDLGPNNVEQRQTKSVTNHQASIIMPDDANEEKAIILYKPDAQCEGNGSDKHEENSKVQLLKVLESRRANLHKEQGMAFARAVAAGFDIDHVTLLLSFAECFGATRLMSACLLFMDLWKRKHENGQWLEIQEEAEAAMSNRSDLCTMNTSGTMISNNGSHCELVSDNKGTEIIGGGAEERHPMDQKTLERQQEYYQGQFPHPVFTSWPMHSPPGTLPIYSAYPVHGVPYYQGFPGNGGLHQPPYRMDDYPPNNDVRVVRKRHSMDGIDINAEFDALEIDGTKLKSKDNLELMKEPTNQEFKKKTSRKKSGVVVIRNINYISKRKNSSASESESSTESEIGQESQDTRNGTSAAIDKNSASFKRKGVRAKAELFKNDNQETSYGKEIDDGHWQAFQNILLRDADRDKYISDNGMFASEKNIQMKRKPNLASEDPLTLGNQNPDGHGHNNTTKYMEIRGNGVYRSTTDDSFMVDEREPLQFRNSSDQLAVDGFEYTSNTLNQGSPADIPDDSFIVPFRSMTLNQIGTDGRTTIDMNSELPSKLQKSEYNSFKANKSNYEPYDLNLKPESRVQNETAGYDPALEYKLEVRNGTVAKNLDRDKKSKDLPGASDKKKAVGPIRKGKPSKMSPLDDARARAEKLRNYKADLQKMKKEMAEKELKRLEALKTERLKRIANKGSSTPTQSSLHSPQSKKQFPTNKLSPSSHPGSKFSDSQTGPSSPLQRSKIRISSHISSNSNKASKTSNSSSQVARNRLVKSVSSLPDLNKEDKCVTSDSKASMARIRRLSEPRSVNNSNIVPLVKRNLELISKPKEFSGHDSKKVSSIINPTKSKAKRTIDGRTKPTAKEMTEKVDGAKISKLGINQAPCDNNVDTDENSVIEKTVVMLECEKPSVAVHHVSSEHVCHQQTGQFDNKEESIDIKNGIGSENVLPNHGVVNIQGGGKQNLAVAHEEMTRHSEEKQQKFHGNLVVEKPYQAPYARPDTLEDKCAGNSEYAKAPSVILDMPAAETSKVHVSGSNSLKLERIPEMPEMLPQLKESPKGFKRLLKFGRKNWSSSSSDKKYVSDKACYGSEADESVTNAVSSEVHTLKNLISLDESPPTSVSKSQKHSRHFSLLSAPFRSKTC